MTIDGNIIIWGILILILLYIIYNNLPFSRLAPRQIIVLRTPDRKRGRGRRRFY